MKHRLLTRLHRLRSRVADQAAAKYARARHAVSAAEQALLVAQGALAQEATANGLPAHELDRRSEVVKQCERDIETAVEGAEACQRELAEAAMLSRRAEILRDAALASFRDAREKNEQKHLDDLASRRKVGS
jgi:flagellar biosynthesis chaperone FliJ